MFGFFFQYIFVIKLKIPDCFTYICIWKIFLREKKPIAK